jgi:hypothetical protein
MLIVAVLCPKTSQHISTGVELDQAELDALPAVSRTVECWACGGTHSWSKRWATVIECQDPHARRAGAPVFKANVPTPA